MLVYLQGLCIVEDRFSKKEKHGRVLQIRVIYEGRSAEHGISLNFARSVFDHIQIDFVFDFVLILYLCLVI